MQRAINTAFTAWAKSAVRLRKPTSDFLHLRRKPNIPDARLQHVTDNDLTSPIIGAKQNVSVPIDEHLVERVVTFIRQSRLERQHFQIGIDDHTRPVV